MEVGAGEQAGGQPVGPEQLGGDPGRRALAVGAGDVDDRVAALRFGQQAEQAGDALEPRLDPLADALIEEGDGLFV
ncbi:MAG: hypothetical protein KJ698_06465 [Actinobacteria bacterium]|jgi:hypothetical protein|nr:hypothetical protein [Actinomycetota bacterium]